MADREFLARIAASPDRLRAGLVCDWLIARVRAFLGVDPHERVEPESRFLELGFDSLRAVDFKLVLEQELDCALRSTVVFDCPTPGALAPVLLAELGLAGAAPADSRASSAASAVSSAAAASGDPIAIVGIACRFPGGATDPESYWRLLMSGRDAITEIPASRWDLDAWYDADRAAPGKMYVRHGGFLDGIDRFDAAFFNITPREAQELDPQQRLLLETAWEALERAGIAPDSLRGVPVAYYLGTRGSDYFIRCSPYLREVIGTYNASGNALSTAAGRVSYVLGLTGPNFALDTACSSSLVALHQAVAALRAGEAPLALAAGVNLILDPVGTVSTCKANMLSSGGRCRAFSDQADGYVRSEGVGTLVLEPLSRALAAGRAPLALVLGSAINQDGASGGLTVPSGAAQAEVIRLALARAGVEPADVAHVEAHGTGTALGDPIEVRALHEVYGAARGRRAKLTISSVKTSIGHCETAAGMAGVISAVQALRHGELPALLHCERQSSHIDWATVAVEPLRERRSFARANGAPRRVGVSSFGFSGTNGHVVIGEAPAPQPRSDAVARPAELVLLSAATPTALRASAARLRAHLAAHAELALPDVARTLAVGRAALRERLALCVRDRAELEAALERDAPGAAATRTPRIAFLYSGQGAQRAGMGRELAAHAPAFRAALERCSAALRPHIGFAVEELLYGARSGELSRTEHTQPALFAFEYALAEQWHSLGVEPNWVLGHSIGEYAAAVAAGVFTLEHAAGLVAARGRLMRELAPEGAMLAVFAPPSDVAALVERLALPLDLAADNAPDLCTWSGAAAPLAELERALQAQRVRCQRLDVSHAFHSRLLEPMLAPFEARVRAAAPSAPRLGFISNLSGASATDELADAARWARHVRAPVRFRECVRALLAADVDVLVEIGPAAVLSGLVRRCEPRARQLVVPAIRAGAAEWASLLQAVGEVWSAGARVDASALHAGSAARLVELPTYPFERERHWQEIPSGPAPAFERAATAGLAGAERASSVLADGARLFESRLCADAPAWLDGHRVFGRVVAPAALYFGQALDAVAAALGTHAIELCDVSIERALELEREPTAVEVLVEPDGDGARWRIASRGPQASAWTRHASGRAERASFAAPSAAAPSAGELDAARARCRAPLDPAQHFAEFAAVGLEYSGPFRGLRAAWSGAGEVLAQLAVDASSGAFPHPALLDLCLQSCRALLDDAERKQTWLPVGIARLCWSGGAQRELYAHARRVEASRGIAISFELYDAAGKHVGALERLQLQRVDARALLGEARLESIASELAWSLAPLAAPSGAAAPGTWIVRGGNAAECERIARALGERGATAAAGATLVAPGAAVRGVVIVATEPGAIPDAVERLARELGEVGSTPVWLVTRGATSPLPSALAADIAGAALAAAFASFARELGAPAVHVDLDPLDPDRVDDLLAELGAPLHPETAESHVAWRFGERYAARLRPLPARAALEPADGASLALRCDGSGSLASLRVVPLARREPGAGELELEIDACGLNFKDVLYALGRLAEFARSKGIDDPRQWPLGMEACGRVARVGPGVDDVAVGERVWCIGTGLAARHAVVLREQVARAPSTLTDAQAAAQPVAWSTVLWALERLADLRAGETLLVNGAAGAVGHAAIRHARRVGARVVAVADRAKHAYLRRLGAQVVVDSHGEEPLHALARSGERVDVVLSGLGGAVVAANLALLRPRGRYVELGKLGVWTSEQIAAARADVGYHVFDLELELGRHRDWMRAALERLAREIDAGACEPIPTCALDARDARAGFELLARRRAIGKLALGFRPTGLDVRADRTYVVSGGRGGLGLAIAERLVDAGARHVRLLARSAPGPEVDARLDAWRARGVRVECERCDVADAVALRTALGNGAWPEIDAAIHAAGVLRDALRAGIRREDVAAQLAPKLDGLAALRAALGPRARIVATSSMAGVVGSAGQASYAAANAALDALVAQHARNG
ncbi:MAG: SDR family NAD(P)-dependent oxidoreductase, partial [Planctomycetota bacterium]